MTSKRSTSSYKMRYMLKKKMLYPGGTIYGKSVDNPKALSKTVLGIMVNGMFGGPSFLTKMLSVSNLNF